MKLEFLLSENAKDELKKLFQETIKEELKTISSLSQTKQKEDSEFLNRKDTAKFLGCSLTTLYHYQRKNLIPYCQVGRKILFNKADLINHTKVKAV